jgi:FlaA1/EpsC-like NDP-sugar epimerase
VINFLIQLPRIYKQSIMIIADSLLLILIVLVSFALRLGYWYWPEPELFLIIFSSTYLAIPIFIIFGLYHSVSRFFGIDSLWAIFKAVSLYALLWGLIENLSGIEGIPRSVILINWMLSFIGIAGLRFITRKILNSSNEMKIPQSKSIIIYGAGTAGRQLMSALTESNEYRPVAFIDDSKNLKNQIIHGIRVHDFKNIESLIKKYKVEEVFLAITSISRKNRNNIINKFQPFSLKVKILPSVVDMVKGNVSIDDLRKVRIDDLLGRDSVQPNQSLLKTNIKNKVVMVTGAGGSIGSELCRQICKLGAKKLILFDQSEAALYMINLELDNSVEIIPILGSVVNQDRIEKICLQFSVQTIYHSAAYKHVPMVEFNNTEGVLNNIFGTLSAANAAVNCGVETFVLISTDKAVRPSNTMGATKRCSEIILQALSEKQKITRFMIVRFGNVLDSSGSVIPLFKKQIKEGGPLTITDKEIVRYFMTISEAVELVIQAGAMGEGGDVFVLNMGEPVRIYDLACKMIKLSGLEVMDDKNPNGDIEIKYIGLRPGEKLYEELLVSGDVSETKHSLIMRAVEELIEWSELEIILKSLEEATNQSDHRKIRELLIKIVPQFKPQSKIVDVLFRS